MNDSCHNFSVDSLECSNYHANTMIQCFSRQDRVYIPPKKWMVNTNHMIKIGVNCSNWLPMNFWGTIGPWIRYTPSLRERSVNCSVRSGASATACWAAVNLASTSRCGICFDQPLAVGQCLLVAFCSSLGSHES